jgi:hypothetical protein
VQIAGIIFQMRVNLVDRKTKKQWMSTEWQAWEKKRSCKGNGTSDGYCKCFDISDIL